MSKFSFTTMGTPELNGTEAIKLAKKLGYDGVDLRVSDVKGELTLNSTNAEIAELKKVFASEGVLSAGLLCYGKRKVPLNEAYWPIFEETLTREVEIGALLGSPSIRMFGGDVSSYHSQEEYIDRMAKGINNALSAFPNMTIVLQHHCNSYSFMQGVALANHLKNDRFSLVFSPDHCFLMQENFEEVLRLVKKYSKQIYVSDMVLDKSGKVNERNYISGQPVLPGQGDIKIKESLLALGGKKFEGWITFKWEKIWHDELEEPEIALPYFLKYIKNLLNEC
jgi:sugar phosphate isomerase/epimerase